LDGHEDGQSELWNEMPGRKVVKDGRASPTERYPKSAAGVVVKN
jgi:hypothetical protein